MKLEKISPDIDIYIGEKPETYKDVYDLAQLGIKAILNVEQAFDKTRCRNTVHEEVIWANACHLAVIHIKMSNFFAPTQEEVTASLRILCQLDRHPIYVHGGDHALAVIASYKLLILGQPWDEVKEDMLGHGFHVFPHIFWMPKIKSYTFDK